MSEGTPEEWMQIDPVLYPLEHPSTSYTYLSVKQAELENVLPAGLANALVTFVKYLESDVLKRDLSKVIEVDPYQSPTREMVGSTINCVYIYVDVGDKDKKIIYSGK